MAMIVDPFWAILWALISVGCIFVGAAYLWGMRYTGISIPSMPPPPPPAKKPTNVVDLPVITTLDIPCERILSKAIAADLKEVLIIGTDKKGEFYFASSFGDGGNVLWLTEKAKIELMKIAGAL